jgi:hypothetical protein
MIFDPPCRFCNGKLYNYMNLNQDMPSKEPEYLYDCASCDSRQCFKSNGECTHYQFTIAKYSFCFNPVTKNFRLLRLPDVPYDESKKIISRKPIIELDYLPVHLTPSTVNEERVRMMVLFS